MTDSIYLGESPGGAQALPLRYANRHGLVTGATGTGKTITLQGLVEGFSDAGVPVVIADVKGDLSGLSQPGHPKEPLVRRAETIGYALRYNAYPVIYWDIFAQAGHPLRTTVSEMGPLLLARMLELNDTQEGVLTIAFAVADAEGLLLLDLDDLRAVLRYIGENAAEVSARYGNVSAASIGAIQRALLALEQQGGKKLFGEPALAIADLAKVAPGGQGAVNIIAAEALMHAPKLYASFMLWLMSELFEDMPEIGDTEKPRLVFFFDEAHLLFDNAPPALVNKIEQLVKLIRSKGVGIYFITQNPADIPDSVLSQLSSRIQHALRAYTPKEQKAIRAAAQSFRSNPAFKTEQALVELEIGEALVSVLEERGAPGMVQRTLIKPPASRVGPVNVEERRRVMAQSPLASVYEQEINRESAYEMLTARVEKQETAHPWGMAAGQERPRSAPLGSAPARRGRQPDNMTTVMTKSVMRSVGSAIGRELVRGLLKSLRR